ncbi:Soluble lytic murein transglycosylase [Hyphomicrobiales bacterium]|nr:lytic transglycosylase domain-containing protein [Pseudomonadota bacterium]CAH1696338.1 Soluble lytic murein transglycosylase [Hyphomicrobiales bacterium]CAH1696575.1 Soluble lytic murein transglycosylase [Hyphomicrobiales bacterium]
MSARRRTALAGIALLAAASAASAQQSGANSPIPAKRQERLPAPAERPVVRTASVDPDGRIVPGGTDSAKPVQRIGEGARADPDAAKAMASPCAESAPLNREEARRLVETTAREEQFMPEFVLSVAQAESRYNSTSFSGKGAYGLMQLMPATAQAFGVDICDPKDNVRGGIAFLRELTAKYRNPVYVLAAYNAGEPAVLEAGGVPPTPETVGFVAAVLNEFYQWPALSSRTDAFAPAPRSGRNEFAGEPTGRVPRTAAPARPGARRQAEGWQGGFVQNFD